MAATLSPEQIGQLVYNQFSNPFDYLGPHKVGSNGSSHWTVRAVFPNAESVVLIDLGNQTAHPMERKTSHQQTSDLGSPQI